MSATYKILIMGASYGSLLASKFSSAAIRCIWSACRRKRT
jgi:hypothetical protein